MGKTYLSIFFLFVSTTLYCKGQQWELLPTAQPLLVHSVNETHEPNTLFLPMPFAQHSWSTSLKDELATKEVLSISLVYTKYRTVASFDQVGLNRARIQRLRSFAPELFNYDLIEWLLVEQSGADSRETGNQYFHGFIIQTRPKSSEKHAAAELKDIATFKNHLINGTEPESDTESKKVELSTGSASSPNRKKVNFYIEESQIRTLDSPAQVRGGNEGLTNFLIDNLTYPEEDLKSGTEGTVLVSFTVNPDGTVISVRTLNTVSPKIDEEAIRVMNLSPKWKPATDDGNNVASTYTIPIQFDADGDGKTPSGKSTKTRVTLEFVPFGKDEVVTEALDRNEWSKMAIVCDLTGSMTPYTKQLLRWFYDNLDNDRIQSFTFFNDGDGMPDRKKKIGQVGGIYHLETHSISELTDLAMKVMKNGNGDDTPENNLEAAIEAARSCPECELVMIADNYATPRDLRLVEELNRPLRIILCGASPFLNTAYLQLAYNTNGSVHTLFNDIADLNNLPNGSTIDFGVFRYRHSNGRFVKEPLQ